MSERGPGGICADTEAEGTEEFKPIGEMDNYICRPETFERQIIEYIKTLEGEK